MLKEETTRIWDTIFQGRSDGTLEEEFFKLTYSDFATPYSMIVAAQARPEFAVIRMGLASYANDNFKPWPMCETIKPARPAKQFYMNMLKKAKNMCVAQSAIPTDFFRYNVNTWDHSYAFACDPTRINWDAFHIVINLVACMWTDEGYDEAFRFEGSEPSLMADTYEFFITVDGGKRISCLSALVSAMTGIPEGDAASAILSLTVRYKRHDVLPIGFAKGTEDEYLQRAGYCLFLI
jgi:hypothetical protein